MPDNRDHQRPKTNPHGVVLDAIAEEKTAVGTDAQVFRAVKALHKRLDDNEKKSEAAHGALTAKVAALETVTKSLDAKQDKQSEIIEKFDEKLDATIAGHAKIVGYIEGQRDEANRRAKSPSSTMRMVQETTSTTLAGKVVDDMLEERRSKRKNWATIIGGVFSTSVLTAIITAAATGHC